MAENKKIPLEHIDKFTLKVFEIIDNTETEDTDKKENNN